MRARPVARPRHHGLTSKRARSRAHPAGPARVRRAHVRAENIISLEKEAVMKTYRRDPQELFESVSHQGIRWAFVIQPSDRWTITRRGKQVARGTSDRASVHEGVQRFMSLTAPRAIQQSREKAGCHVEQ